MRSATEGVESRRILLLSQWYPPEHAPIGFMFRELAADLAAAGWKVTVLTGFPNHPGGAVFGGYRKRWFQEEMVDGIRVWRVYLYTSRNRSRFRRMLTFLSFTLSSSLAILLRERPHVVFSVLQPLSVGLTLPVIRWWRPFGLVFNVQDLHPDAPIELGLIRNRWLIRMLRGVERFAYRHSDRIAVICDGFRSHCIARGAAADKVATIGNWVDLEAIRPGESGLAFRAELGLRPDDFVVLYAGTIGHVSGARIAIDVAKRLRDHPSIKLAMVGDGPLLGELKERARAAGLTNLVFAPFQPRERLNEVQAMADLSIVSLLPGKGKLSVPSKVLGYMAAARCVVCSADADSETARLVRTACCGIVTAPGDPDAMAEAILAMQADARLRETMATNGRAYLEAHLSRPIVTEHYRFLFEELARERCSA